SSRFSTTPICRRNTSKRFPYCFSTGAYTTSGASTRRASARQSSRQTDDAPSVAPGCSLCLRARFIDRLVEGHHEVFARCDEQQVGRFVRGAEVVCDERLVVHVHGEQAAAGLERPHLESAQRFSTRPLQEREHGRTDSLATRQERLLVQHRVVVAGAHGEAQFVWL